MSGMVEKQCGWVQGESCGYVPLQLTFKAGTGRAWHMGCDWVIVGWGWVIGCNSDPQL